jgi:hypothetical protein
MRMRMGIFDFWFGVCSFWDIEFFCVPYWLQILPPGSNLFPTHHRTLTHFIQKKKKKPPFQKNLLFSEKQNPIWIGYIFFFFFSCEIHFSEKLKKKLIPNQNQK